MMYSEDSKVASLTFPVCGSTLKKGSLCMIKDHPCKLTNVAKCVTSKHGHAKIKVVGTDIFDHRKYDTVAPAHSRIDVPVVSTVTYCLMGEEDGFLSLLDSESGEMRDDLRVPESEMGESLKRALAGIRDSDSEEGCEVEVTVMEAMGQSMVVNVKTVAY